MAQLKKLQKLIKKRRRRNFFQRLGQIINIYQISQKKKKMGQIKSKIIKNLMNKKQYTSLESFTNSYLIYHEILDLNFSQRLYEEHALIIQNAIKKCQQLKNLTLNLSQNQLNFQTLQLIMNGIHECLNLQFLNLNLRNVCLKDKGEYLGSSIAKNRNIQHLTLKMHNNSIHNQDAYDIVLGISKCTKLTNLALIFNSNNDIEDQGISFIGQSLAQFKNLQNLKLVIWFNNKGVACLQNLQMGIAQCENLSILTLIIGFQNKQITQQSINTLAYQIKAWKKLTSLSLILDIQILTGQRNYIIDLQAKKLERLVSLKIIYL
ncbi:hypothetical protein TTHERM_00802320 (macronuclear) [Tetrahymena thermophila SB210]|uniref:Kinase domain protein n=1 Tax=Tetrahymena thermophila (strain SB210) TaxID=312017 RepID=Q235G8_TETTS|nr:hypothetical protein TTHERM_00802320 [Tetrahymena thermophila SB210]EAR92135.2 hypothetical protein TTHERM_00802320 [Tetrahymena thermophila SB210]|eukprot:XP_001012380.2 hypothetical protein TTHERM_00802320 [Tetrahymena thermophila SB210]